MGSGLPAPARDFHRAGSPRLQASRWQIALLGILLEGLSGNRHRLPHQEPSHNRSPAVLRLISNRVLVHCPFREPMLPATVCHLSAAGTPTASWPSAQSGANASCGYLPPQRRRYSNRVLVQCPVGLSMPPAVICHLSAAGTPTASWFTALFGSQSLLRLSATSALPILQPRPGPLPFSGANASCDCLPPHRCLHSNRVLVHCPGASSEDYFPARCFSQAQAEARVSSIGRSAFQPSSFSARVGSAQMATTSPGRRGANL